MNPNPDELLARIKKLEEERDAYLRALYAMTRHEKITFTAEELADLDKNGIPFEDIVQEVKDMFRQAKATGQQGNAA